MRNKWLFVMIGAVVIGVSLYIFIPENKEEITLTALPNKNQIKEMIHETAGFEINTILELIFIDEKHIFVPHLSSDNYYGLSLLQWQDNDWKITYGDSSGRPLIWKIDDNNKVGSYFIWNIDPNNNLKNLHFYLIRDRYYKSGWGGEFYDPAIQIVEAVPLNEKPYGIYKVPEKWEKVSEAVRLSMKEKDMDIFSFSMKEGLHYGVKGYDKENKYVQPMNMHDDISFSSTEADTEYVSVLEELDGEQW